jgi:hypothetical protein
MVKVYYKNLESSSTKRWLSNDISFVWFNNIKTMSIRKMGTREAKNVISDAFIATESQLQELIQLIWEAKRISIPKRGQSGSLES